MLSGALFFMLLTPSAWAQTKITIENNSGSEQLLEQYISQFLSDNHLIENCLRNRSNQENRPLSMNIAVCSIINTFGQESVDLNQAWEQALRLRLISAEDTKSTRTNALEYLDMVFSAAGVSVSPLSEQQYRKDLRDLGVRLSTEETKTLITAFENGIILAPSTKAEAILLQQDLRKPLVIGEAFGFLYQVASSHHDVPIITISPGIVTPELELESILKEVVRLIKTQSYYNDDFDERAAMQAAIKAVAESLAQDKYIEYYTEEEYQSFSENLNGSLEGIGAYLEDREGKIIVVSPIHGSPAEKAGLLPEDIITHINGTSTEEMSLQEAVNLIRGEQGTSVKLTILREGRSQVFTIVRAHIEIPSLTTENKNGIEIIKLIQFSATSAAETYVELDRIRQERPRGLIIDLRNNPGGFLDQVVAIVDYFVEAGSNIVYLDNHSTRTPIIAGKDPIITDIPIAILINKGSASASEILAGTLQSYGIAKVYGETSYGKGTVQNIITLRDPQSFEESAFKLTTSEYLVGAPKGNAISINEIGVIPDSNPNGKDLVDDRDTPQDEALNAVINLMR